jgi:hypothetical protein
MSLRELIAKSATGYDFDPVPIVSQLFIICRPTNFALFQENIFQVSAFQIVKDEVQCGQVRDRRTKLGKIRYEEDTLKFVRISHFCFSLCQSKQCFKNT